MRRSILAACLAVLTACTGGPAPDGPEPPQPTRSPLVATRAECPSASAGSPARLLRPVHTSCVAGVIIADDFYAEQGCVAPVEEAVLGELVAVGEPLLAWDRFRALAEARTRILLAARATSQTGCRVGGWFLVRRVGPQRSREEAFGLHHDACLIEDEDLCKDRVLEWDINSGKEHIGFAYLPERIERVNAAIDAGDPEFTWRNDPFEVLRREPYWQRCGKHAPPQLRCRAGAWVTERSESRISITVLQQGVSKGQYSSWETHFWLERLDGGTGWWLVERKKGKYTLHAGRGEPSRAASDARWADCCDAVLFDGGTE